MKHIKNIKYLSLSKLSCRDEEIKINLSSADFHLVVDNIHPIHPILLFPKYKIFIQFIGSKVS